MTDRSAIFGRLDQLDLGRVRAMLDADEFAPEEIDTVLHWLALKHSGTIHGPVQSAQLLLKIEDGMRQEAAASERRKELALANRSAVAAETQANYAKRAFHRSNYALLLSGISIIVAGLFALLDFLKP